MRILILGDVVGRPARRAVRDLVPSLIQQEELDLVVANAENSAGGMGVDIRSAKELLSAGVHVLTSGNHIWKKKEIYSYLGKQPRLLRPANYPDGAPGQGWVEWQRDAGTRAQLPTTIVGERVFEGFDPKKTSEGIRSAIQEYQTEESD